jgi:hypothetical protein
MAKVYECSWCGKKYTKSYKGYCSEECWDADWFDRPRTIGRFYDDPGGESGCRDNPNRYPWK